ncbi:hypothetical protein TNCV_2500641 [Trichonephila clavipes]|nr:hypothetical protein TNCV_2500641 [Trichonephila clavipes]
MREDACVRTCQPDDIYSEKLKDLCIADVVLLYTAVLRPILSYGCPVWVHAANGRILNRGLSLNYPRTGGNSQIGETSLFSTADRAKSTDYSSKDELDEDDFRRRYRFYKGTIETLVKLLRTKLDPATGRNHVLTAAEKVLAAVRFFCVR